MGETAGKCGGKWVDDTFFAFSEPRFGECVCIPRDSSPIPMHCSAT